MSRTRIPETIHAFNAYINVTAIYLAEVDPDSGLLNWQRLGLTPAQLAEWQSRHVHWRDTLYVKYGNVALSSKTVKGNVRIFMRNFRKFANPLLMIMSASNAATTKDEASFRFKRFKKKPGFHTVAIADHCGIGIKYLGGATLRIQCRVPEAEGRPRKADKADSVQVMYRLGNEAPDGLLENGTREIFTKSVFIFRFGMENAGKRFYMQARWYNTRHPHLAGPWSNLTTGFIA